MVKLDLENMFGDVFECLHSHIEELKQRGFWEAHVNRKWGLNMPWRNKICIAQFLYTCVDDLTETFWQNHC